MVGYFSDEQFEGKTMRILMAAATIIAFSSGVTLAAEDHNTTRTNQDQVAAPADSKDHVLRKRPGRVKYGDVTLKRGADAETNGDDPLLRKRPGRIKTEDSAASTAPQIDPPSVQLDAGPADTAAAKKPKEIVVVGSKAKAATETREDARRKAEDAR
jgi:hypothetical protein